MGDRVKTELEVAVRDEALTNFCFDGFLKREQYYMDGHINDAYCIECQSGDDTKRYILQKINTNVFKDPMKLMDNIESISAHIRRKIYGEGGDAKNRTMTVIKTLDGKPCYRDSMGGYWRAYDFVEGSSSLKGIPDDEIIYYSGYAFGEFLWQLADYPMEGFYCPIDGFHNTPKRLKELEQAVGMDQYGRGREISQELEFVREHQKKCTLIEQLYERGKIPKRIVHNDAKLNNVLMQADGKESLCVIDLDTVMPGYASYDFGDGIRYFGSKSVTEDEPPEHAFIDMEVFDCYLKGYLDGTDGILTEEEIRTMPLGARSITFECGVRFLTDYLQGDKYFKITRASQNIDRCRIHFELVKYMEKHWDEMMSIMEKQLKRYKKS